MKAAVVRVLGQAPEYGDFPDPSEAVGQSIVWVSAAALSRTSKGRAAGTHYDSAPPVPFVPGIDGVGRLGDGRRVYFAFPTAPFGAMAERALVKEDRCVALPDGIDDRTAAGIANPGMASWAALTERARLSAGETVLVNGATGAAGRLAVQVAKHLGAGRVVATGRNAEALRRAVELGADATISLAQEPSAVDAALAEQFGQGVDVVLDFLWGQVAERLLVTAARNGRDTTPLRYVEIGTMAGASVSLPGAVLRSSSITLMGSGTGGIPLSRLVERIAQMFRAAADHGWKVDTEAVPLAQVHDVWTREGDGSRVVFTVG